MCCVFNPGKQSVKVKKKKNKNKNTKLGEKVKEYIYNQNISKINTKMEKHK